jgi:hypothetical protein
MIVYKPKGDFEDSIKIKKQYIQLLKEYHAQLMIKKDKGNEYIKSKMRVDLYELSQKLDKQIELCDEKCDVFYNHFLPGYDLQLKECEENFDKVFLEAHDISKKASKEVIDKINHTIKSYKDLDEENQAHTEVKNVIYRDLKILLTL